MTIISYNHRLIYIHIPKCGGSSVEIEFERGIRWGDFVVGSTRAGEILHAAVFLPLYGIYKHNTAAELKRIIGDEAFSGFELVTTVRDPLTIVESYYKFSKTIVSGIASHYQRQQASSVSENYAIAWAVDQIRAGAFDNQPLTMPLGMMRGAIKAGALASSFEEFLVGVADDRWHAYLKSRTHDADGSCLVQRILKLESKREIEAYFSARLGRQFRLGHANASKMVDTVWPGPLRQLFYELLSEDYDTFGYERT
jgi:hypothetical protein